MIQPTPEAVTSANLGDRFFAAVGSLLLFVLAILFLVAMAWGIWHRTPVDFAKYGGMTALLTMPAWVVVSVVVLSIRNEGVDDQWWSKLQNIRAIVVFVAVVSLLAGVFYYAVAAAMKDLYVYWTGLVWSRESYIATALATFCVGSMLYVIRYKLRCLFGLSEILVGISIAAYKVSTSIELNSDLFLLLLTAGVYIVVRGFDNFQQGLEKEQDLLLKWVLRRDR